MSIPFISVNGVQDALVSPLDRGFSYGDGFFETCRCVKGRIPLWPYHRERLLKSAERLNIPIDEQLLQRYLEQALFTCSAVPDSVVKIQVTRGVGGRGYRLPENTLPTYFVGVFPGSPLDAGAFRDGASVRICDIRLGKNPALAGIKHLNRLEHILARAEWVDEYTEGLLLSTDGKLIEATVSNLFIVKDKQLLTPDLSEAGVAGIMRRVIIEVLAPQLNLPVKITDCDLTTLAQADEVFLSNSVYGIWPVNQITGLSAKWDQSITRSLQKKLTALFADI